MAVGWRPHESPPFFSADSATATAMSNMPRFAATSGTRKPQALPPVLALEYRGKRAKNSV